MIGSKVEHRTISPHIITICPIKLALRSGLVVCTNVAGRCYNNTDKYGIIYLPHKMLF